MSLSSSVMWYRQPMLWLVLGLPFITVIAGISTLFIAMHKGDDAMPDIVARVGVAQLAKLEPELLAQSMELTANMHADRKQRTISVHLSGETLPDDERLRLDLRHITDGSHDLMLELKRHHQGQYEVLIDDLPSGVWQISLAPLSLKWRLHGRWDGDRSAYLSSGLERG